MQLHWTTKPPTEPGPYWYRLASGSSPTLLWVVRHRGFPLAVERKDGLLFNISIYPGEWAVPIPTPTCPECNGRGEGED